MLYVIAVLFAHPAVSNITENPYYSLTSDSDVSGQGRDPSQVLLPAVTFQNLMWDPDQNPTHYIQLVGAWYALEFTPFYLFPFAVN